jgi:malate synthase
LPNVSSATQNARWSVPQWGGAVDHSITCSCCRCSTRVSSDQRGVEVVGPAIERGDEILTAEALGFVAELQQRFGARRDELLRRRSLRRREVGRTGRLDFLPETRDVRTADWTAATAPADLVDRRVEITGPTEPKMAINALNSGARVWLADLEDANTPHWTNVVTGQVALADAVRGVLAYDAADGRPYRLRDDGRTAVIVVRPRGWHFDEPRVLVDSAAAVAALVDFGLYFFHNARALLERGSGPYFYLPKMESHLEARLWNEVFVAAQERLGIPRGTVRATALIETVPAAFEMDEILYELREHASGLTRAAGTTCSAWSRRSETPGRNSCCPTVLR